MKMRAKRRSMLLSVLLFALLLLSACGTDPNQAMFQAEKKTFSVGTGKMDLLLKMKGKIKVREANGEKEVDWPIPEAEAKIQYDAGKGLSLTQYRLMFDEIGMEGKIYQNRGLIYLVSPLFPKILVLNGAESIRTPSVSPPAPPISEGSIAKLKERWLSLLQEEEAARLGDLLLDTPDGKVKAKKYQIYLTSGNLRSFLADSLAIVRRDETFRKQMEEYVKEYRAEGAPLSADQAFDKMNELLQNLEIGPLSYYAYIDRDGYVIKENLEVAIDQMTLSFDLSRWDLGKSVEINMPEVTEENSQSLESFLRGIGATDMPIPKIGK